MFLNSPKEKHLDQALESKIVLINGTKTRLCHLKKWKDFNGYGFNLHAERSKSIHYIGKVDNNSPAEKAGLKEGDRIVEVNYNNISNENHKQVVKRIRQGLEINGIFYEEEVILLVSDKETEENDLNTSTENFNSNIWQSEKQTTTKNSSTIFNKITENVENDNSVYCDQDKDKNNNSAKNNSDIIFEKSLETNKLEKIIIASQVLIFFLKLLC
jgi:Na(+)/H(+) exchange regulatory cofactor NHE-RF1